ncbi:hypothetical protein LAG90_06070 [Marinilongibacter aquaticus]|uniref:type VI-B CRISPR accessory protein Csx27 n=1 Tax=Marinilongibacter aquaticus TaxID=2975157 RepID=UPI0021BD2975|nr:CRISPR-associated protein Csx27 [Marinilongibacter aquaticus]UBM60208.1 hypothetical protein LAG90_06070 [Marinilongibacter aquaticus]
MDKLSLYEFLSFFLPGTLFCFFVYQILPESCFIFSSIENTGDALIFFALALFTGLALHRISFLLLHKSWYKQLIYTPVGDMLNNAPKGVFLDEAKEWIAHENAEAEKLFDEAYYRLELENKIDSAKAFQSTYFFLRNTFTGLVLLCLPFTVSFAKTHSIQVGLLILLSSLVLAYLIRNMALFYRGKMIERLFGIYRQLKNEQRNAP